MKLSNLKYFIALSIVFLYIYVKKKYFISLTYTTICIMHFYTEI